MYRKYGTPREQGCSGAANVFMPFGYRMYGQKIAPRQLLLRCPTTYILVGVHFLHFRHPWRSYAAGFYALWVQGDTVNMHHLMLILSGEDAVNPSLEA